MASGNHVTRMSPRQRMINLMYIVLTAFLALNVSSDVLNGFNKVHDSLLTTGSNMSAKNEAQFRYLTDLYASNPEKVGPWLVKGTQLRSEADRLISNIDSLKLFIAREADGKNADPAHLVNLEDLEAASVTLLNPSTRKGERLREDIQSFKDLAASLVSDSLKRGAIYNMLATERESSGNVVVEWEESLFDNVPAIAALTHLTKLQADIREAESEAMANIISGVDIDDVRVNELNPYVIPASNLVMRGGKYTARVVLAAVDTTRRPDIFVNGDKIGNSLGVVELPADISGNHEFSGYMEITGNDGLVRRHPFSSSYTVVEPMAVVSPLMMNVLYAGIENPVSISVPGVPMNAVSASMTNGSLRRNGDSWIALPDKIGSDAVISVSALIDGKNVNVGSMTYRVRRLPDPVPFISLKDNQGETRIYKGSPARISKTSLLSADRLSAALDDNILDVPFSVVSFSTVFLDAMGNALPEVSDGSAFSARQKEQIRRLKPGKSFFISNVRAKGPDGIVRSIPPMEVSLN